MEHKLGRIQELINEIKVLREVNSTLHRQINSLQSQVYDKEYEIGSLNTKIDRLQSSIGFLEAERTGIQKKMDNKVKNLENEIRKNGIFNQRVMATSRTKKEYLMIQEMDSLRKVNRILLGFVEILSKTFAFDSDLLKTLVSVAEGVDDRILQLFLDGLKQRIKEEGIPVNVIEANDQISKAN
ncbi:uncharacterized protein VICG_01524 [Vittaforma corneae ATCC 50505]|uniref:Uncharacterized protein n=1 Tax=Vittaforma corneae (strain ATCC 50505) TaxID=993615 RepID=L2GLA0_VITCO|nr:uncharacterized protein VICG_01524 [Vittaforma corneae ATCC 50505]ELA41419.1 hypothetical protein VICG_01524 [Vittaforma corneae ATCC 50505]